MTRKIICIVILAFLLGLDLTPETAANPEVSAAPAVIITDNTDGTVLFAQNSDQPMAPASITKLMTALIVAENSSTSDVVTVGPEVLGLEGAALGLVPGDRITVENLIYGLLIHSANDAANVLAVHVAGSLERFAELMNLKAKSLGLNSSQFRNPHGLPEPGHLTTAKDISTLAVAALKQPIIYNSGRTREKQIEWIGANGQVRRFKLENTNKFLGVYPGVQGLKTGTTIEAGQCLVTFTEWNAGKIIVVLLNSKNRYLDMTTYLDYGFQQVQLKNSATELIEQSWLDI